MLKQAWKGFRPISLNQNIWGIFWRFFLEIFWESLWNSLEILQELFGNCLGILWQLIIKSSFNFQNQQIIWVFHYCLHFQNQLIVYADCLHFQRKMIFFTFQRQLIIKSSFNFQNQLIIYMFKTYCLFTYLKSTII